MISTYIMEGDNHLWTRLINIHKSDIIIATNTCLLNLHKNLQQYLLINKYTLNTNTKLIK